MQEEAVEQIYEVVRSRLNANARMPYSFEMPYRKGKHQHTTVTVTIKPNPNSTYLIIDARFPCGSTAYWELWRPTK